MTNSNQFYLENFEIFQNEFSNNQKQAILYSLYLIGGSNSDGILSIKELKALEIISSIIGYQTNNNLITILSSLEKNYDDELQFFSHLKSLTESQKRWFVVSIFEFMGIDSIPKEKDVLYSTMLLNEINITAEFIDNSIKMATALGKNFL